MTLNCFAFSMEVKGISMSSHVWFKDPYFSERLSQKKFINHSFADGIASEQDDGNTECIRSRSSGDAIQRRNQITGP
jgi:hypothetical protein